MPRSPEELREQAVEILKQRKGIPGNKLTRMSLERLMEELSIYQVELELQNEELMRHQETILRERKLYEDLFEEAPTGYVIIDNNFAVVDANQTFCAMTGREKKDILNKSLTILIMPDYQDHFHLSCRKLFRESIRPQCELALRKGEGSFDVLIEARAINDGDTPTARLSVIDISDRRIWERKVHSLSEDRKRIIESISDGFFVLDRDTKVEYFNSQAELMLGREKEDVIGKKLFETFPEAKGSVFEEIYMKCIADQEARSFETYFGRKPYDNWYHVNVYPNHGGITVYFQVITDRKIAEAALQDNAEELSRQNEEISTQNEELMTQNEEIRQANQQLTELTRQLEFERNYAQDLLDIAGVMFIVINKEGLVTLANKKSSEVLGYELDEIIGKNWFDHFIPEEERSEIRMIHKHVLGEPEHEYESVVNNILRKDGTKRIILWSNSWIERDGELIGTLSSGLDITESHAAQQVVLEKERQLTEAQHIAKTGSWEYDIDNEQPHWSEETYNFFEMDPSIPPPRWEEHKVLVHPDYWEELDAAVKQLMEKGTPYSHEFKARLKSGREKWGRSIGKPVKSKDGNIQKLVGTLQDITEQKRIELELIKARQKAEESDRLKSVFLANMSHEIRTPMNGIMGFAQLLKQRKLGEQAQKQYIDIIHRSGERMLNIINNLIDMSRLEAGQARVSETNVNIVELVHDVCNLVDYKAKEKGLEFNCTINLKAGEELVRTDPDKVQSIVSNLVNNAFKYTPEGSIAGRLSKDKDWLIFELEDTGIGIPEDRIAKVFDRFVQADLNITKEYEGAGLGLAIVKGYLDLLGGKISVRSRVGIGSKFTVQIPYNPQNREERKHNEAGLAELVPDKKLNVLIVEDNEVSDLLLSAHISELSDNILHTDNGRDAIEMVRANPDLDLILMDIKLPIMDGYEATRKIREFNKDVVIIGQTAYAQAGDREKVLACGCDGYVSKPIDRDALMEEIGRLVFSD